MSKILKALADESRLKILKLLSKGETCACRLPSKLGISQPATSQHLKSLHDTGLVEMRKDGTKRIYALSKKGTHILRHISTWE